MSDERRGPDFLCVGARKTGTTWLYHFLRQHPNAAMPVVKELGFLHNRLWDPKTSRRKRLELVRRKSDLQRNRHRPRFEKHPHLFPDPPRRGGLGDALDWYLGFFELAREQAAMERGGSVSDYLSGDISPMYQNMTRRQLAHLRTAFPDVKVIYILRDPVPRLWSDFVMEFSRKHPAFDGLSERECVDFILNKTIKGALHAQIVAQWQAAYGDRLLVLVYDDLAKDPVAFARRICQFLGIPHADALASAMKNPNPGRQIVMPRDAERALSQVMLPELVRLHELLGLPATEQWLREAEDKALN